MLGVRPGTFRVRAHRARAALDGLHHDITTDIPTDTGQGAQRGSATAAPTPTLSEGGTT